MSIKNIINGRAETVFPIKRSNVIVNTCKAKLKKRFFVAAFLWRHLMVFTLH